MYNLRLHSFLHINAERQVNVTKTLNDNVNSITPNVFVKLLFKQIPVSYTHLTLPTKLEV